MRRLALNARLSFERKLPALRPSFVADQRFGFIHRKLAPGKNFQNRNHTWCTRTSCSSPSSRYTLWGRAWRGRRSRREQCHSRDLRPFDDVLCHVGDLGHELLTADLCLSPCARAGFQLAVSSAWVSSGTSRPLQRDQRERPRCRLQHLRARASVPLQNQTFDDPRRRGVPGSLFPYQARSVPRRLGFVTGASIAERAAS